MRKPVANCPEREMPGGTNLVMIHAHLWLGLSLWSCEGAIASGLHGESHIGEAAQGARPIRTSDAERAEIVQQD